MHSFAQELAGFDFGEHRFPVMMWVREASVVKMWARVSASALNSSWHFTTFRGNPYGCWFVGSNLRIDSSRCWMCSSSEVSGISCPEF